MIKVLTVREICSDASLRKIIISDRSRPKTVPIASNIAVVGVQGMQTRSESSLALTLDRNLSKQ